MAGVGDPLKFVTAGERVAPSADAWNAHTLAARHDSYSRSKLDPLRPDPYSPTVVRVSNTKYGASDLDRFAIVALGKSVVTPDAGEYMPTFIAKAPTGDECETHGAIAVLLDPISVGFIGRAIVAGVVQVTLGDPVNMPDGTVNAPGLLVDAIHGDTAKMYASPFARYPIIALLPFDEDLGQRAFVQFDDQSTGLVRATIGAAFPPFSWIHPGSDYLYGWNFAGVPSAGGSVGVWVDISHDQFADSMSIPDIYHIAVRSTAVPVASTWTITEDGTPHVFNFDDSTATINAALSHFTMSGGLLGLLSGLTANGNDNMPHTLTIDTTNLSPKSHGPAKFENQEAMATPLNGIVWRIGGAPTVADVELSQMSDGSTTPMIWTVPVTDFNDGFINFQFDGGSLVEVPFYAASASDVQTALSTLLTCTVTLTDGVYTITTSANSVHTLNTDVSNANGTQVYGVIWSNGNAAQGAFGGLDPTQMPGWAYTDVQCLSHTVDGTYAAVWVTPSP